MKTPMLKKEAVIRVWHLVDVNGQTLGRTATKIARLLMGKDKPTYTPHVDGGDYVVVVNAQKVAVTGNKTQGKIYRHHTGYPGGFREFSYEQVMAKNPKKIIEFAVKGMLPKNKLRDLRMKRLKIFIGDVHPYENHLKNKEVKV